MKTLAKIGLLWMAAALCLPVQAQDSSGVRRVGQLYSHWDTAHDVAVAGDLAYVATGNSGLRIVSIADPAHPTEIGYCDTPEYASDVAVSGNYAYVADEGSGLRVVDITNPSSPFEAGFYDTPGEANGVVVLGNYAYVADYRSGLRVVDISNPSSPFEAGFYDTPGEARGVAVAGNYAYVADRQSGLRVVDISNPSSPYEAGFYDPPGYALGVAVQGDYVYVAAGESGLRVLNITNPSNPFEAGFYDTPGLAEGVAVAGNYAYVADYYHFGIYDCSEALNTTRCNTIISPAHFVLHPAFPNPFNARTMIRLDLPQTVRGRLVVYDLLGREAATLVSGLLNAGSHEISFNGNGLASGTYFVRLESAEFFATQKLVLMK